MVGVVAVWLVLFCMGWWIIYVEDNISLNQVRAESNFNFRSVYESEDVLDDLGIGDSPYTNYSSTCDYCDPLKFQQGNSARVSTNSFFT